VTGRTVAVELVGGPDDGRVIDVPADADGRPPERLGPVGSWDLDVEFGPGVHLAVPMPVPDEPRYDVVPSGRTDGVAWLARYRPD
jgi:hypothetical protein